MQKPAVFLGSKPLGLEVLRSLHEHSPDLRWTIIHPEDSADPRSARNSFVEFADQQGLRLLEVASRAAAREAIQSVAPNIGFVCGWYWIIDPATLRMVPEGLWGIHNSVLPRFRGGSPLVWSIINGDPEIGSSIFRLTNGIDDGPILHQIRFAIGPDDTVADALRMIESRIRSELPDQWARLIDGGARFAEQDERAATYCGIRREGDGRIDWKKPAAEVHNFVRAQTLPYPGAFTFLDGRKIRILRTRVFPVPFFGTPGQILRISASGVCIACGDGGAVEIFATAEEDSPRHPAQVFRTIETRLE